MATPPKRGRGRPPLTEAEKKKREKRAKKAKEEAAAKREKEREIERLRIENLQSRCDALANQINPHFFFNSLNGVQSLIRKKDDEKTLMYVHELSDTASCRSVAFSGTFRWAVWNLFRSPGKTALSSLSLDSQLL